MSSSFVFNARPLPINVAVGAATATIIDGTDNAVTVASFEVNETGSDTGNLTVEIYDGTTHFYLGDDSGTLWNAQAKTAHKSYKFSGPYSIAKGSKLRVVNASGTVNVVGSKLPNGV